MKRLLTILLTIAIIFTFSFAGAFAATFVDSTVGTQVNAAINAVDTTKYLVKDEAAIATAKADLIEATKDETEYNATVIAAINDFNNTIAAIKTIANQKTELSKEKTEANTTIDNELLKLTTTLEDELKAANNDTSKQRLTTLTADLATYKAYLKDKVAAVEIIDNRTNFTDAEVDLTAAKGEIKTIVDGIATGVKDFYTVRDRLDKRATLYIVAENYAKKMALEFEKDAVTRVYSDTAIAAVLADVKDEIKLLNLETNSTVEKYMKDNAEKVNDEKVNSLANYKTKAIESITTGAYALTNYSDTAKTEVAKIHATYTAYINGANSTSLVDAYVTQAKSAMSQYKSDVQIKEDNDKLTNLDKENKELADKLAKLEADNKVINLVNAQTDTLKCRSAKTAKGNIKVTVKGFDATEIIAAGYTVKYTYYRATSGSYKTMLTKNTQTYLNTIGKKGVKYSYKVKVAVYDKDSNLIVMTKLSDCRAAVRTK